MLELRRTGFHLKAACIAGVSAALLSACATDDISTLSDSRLSGNTYADKLAANYLDYAKFEYEDMYDSVDASYFAQKGQKALGAGNVAPEQPEKWDISDKAMMSDLQTQRQRLMTALSAGAAAKLPGPTARAMVSYDCWVEQSEEAWQKWDIEACRTQFMRAMSVVDQGMQPAAAVIEKETTVVPAPAPAPAPQQYLVFFDWDSAQLDERARQIVETAAKNAREANVSSVVVVGHADRSGPQDYNQRLSMRRADAVAEVLNGMGFDDSDIRMTGRGEAEPLVPTGDGVREPQNRRVRITISDRPLGA